MHEQCRNDPMRLTAKLLRLLLLGAGEGLHRSQISEEIAASPKMAGPYQRTSAARGARSMDADPSTADLIGCALRWPIPFDVSLMVLPEWLLAYVDT